MFVTILLLLFLAALCYSRPLRRTIANLLIDVPEVNVPKFLLQKFKFQKQNKEEKIVVIGGNAAGCSVAAKARRMSEKADIVIYEMSENVSWANCGLPYYIGGIVKPRKELIRTPTEVFNKEMNIVVHTKHKAVSVDAEKKTIQVWDLEQDEKKTVTFDKLVISTGTKNLCLPIENINSPNIFPLKTVAHVDKIKSWLDNTKDIKNVLICGAGAIGLETGENFMQLGFNVTVVDMAPHVLPRALDLDMAQYFQRKLKKGGMKFIFNDAIQSFQRGEGQLVEQATLRSGKIIKFDLALASLGIIPNTEFLKDSKIEMDRKMVKVNSKMQTNFPYIYACGDIVQSKHLVTNKIGPNFLAGPASKQGRIVGNNVIVPPEKQLEFPGVLNTFIIEVFGFGCGKTGLSERECIQNEYDYGVSIVLPKNHVGYYPKSERLALKMVYDKKTEKILGAQAIGRNGAARRLDVLSTAITGGLTIYDVEHLDLCYSPQFGAPKDAVCMLALYAGNQLSEECSSVTFPQFEKMLEEHGEENIQILDVRTPEEYKKKHYPNSILIDYEDDFRNDLLKHNLDKEKLTFIYCRAGWRGYRALLIMKDRGFTNVHNISGGFFFMKK
ncbi:phage shock protein e-related protein [Anaeramoeba flamelloides]|uniref:Phage shock protein e-related protein n=1 Tax=Anaeramoeba flamelloides TaxID=1746091 RepID=A0AAV7ZPW7_9EUKA|nr:phage shock protein e-related protein [Anaeramoeba flamelloides]